MDATEMQMNAHRVGVFLQDYFFPTWFWTQFPEQCVAPLAASCI